MKYYYLLLIFFTGFFQAQQLKVVDAENGNPISNARILLQNQILYTNDDGVAPVEQTVGNFEVSSSGFQTQKMSKFTSLIKLKPVYKDIDEIKIISVDVRKIFEDLEKNYSKRYFDEPSLYDVVYKEKAFDNNKLFFLTVAEAKFWAKTNRYNFKDGYHKKYDDILQMQLNNVKYLKKVKSDSIFKGQVQSDEVSHEYIGSYFFNYELNRTLNNIKAKGSKYSGTLAFEDENEQLINFKINNTAGVKLEGEFKYNKADKVITYFEVHYMQSDYPTYKRKTTDRGEFDYKLGDASLIYDFYKKDGVYVPALSKHEGDGFTIFYKDQVHVRKFSREVIYNTFSKSDKKALDSKVDFHKNIWENIPVKEEKDVTVLLSEEEKQFINQK